ncbi:hypothetical protein CV_1223 [Chromobacterium violaceum ATCC 12472]|uniref:Uncharacterized protein n=1 Tax=Chromobacterium violaceum (strain ATCC 12472 / DSM 30191 / JCM 1249 / CCUG 213 / NBRC 12614 / NCIMB 9131 / NCTC 9757 / MK) TaxID=243365 RepID=Q7NYQ0_CHRVO|nr:hypothetical protein CV_1223 [Chromobacterium violaceum ATCC 12472]
MLLLALLLLENISKRLKRVCEDISHSISYTRWFPTLFPADLRHFQRSKCYRARIFYPSADLKRSHIPNSNRKPTFENMHQKIGKLAPGHLFKARQHKKERPSLSFTQLTT